MMKFCGKEMLIQSLDLLHVPVIFGSDIRCPIFQCLILCHLFGLLSNVQSSVLCPVSNPLSNVQCPATRVAGEGGGTLVP